MGKWHSSRKRTKHGKKRDFEKKRKNVEVITYILKTTVTTLDRSVLLFFAQ